MQDQSVAQRQLPRFKQNLIRVPHIRYAARAPLFVRMNSHAIRASRRDIVLIVMVREIDVVHAKFSLSAFFMQLNTDIGWTTKPSGAILQRNKGRITRVSGAACR